jgi:ribose transport system substrate-binding protein
MFASARRRIPATVFAAIVVLTTAVACSSGSSGGSGGASASPSTAGASSSPAAASSSAAAGTSAAVAATLSAVYKDTSTAPPTSAPTPPKSVSLWLVSCGQQSPTCAVVVQAAQVAAHALGWTSHVCDGAFGANDVSCVRQGLAAKSGAISLIGIDCPQVKQALVEAKAAGIPVVDTAGFDCDDSAFGGGQKLFTASSLDTAAFPTSAQYWQAIGKAQAAAIIANNDQAKIISPVVNDQALFVHLRAGFDNEIKSDCPKCTTIPIPSSSQDYGSGTIVPKIAAALVQHPDVTTIELPQDSIYSTGLAQALKASGMESKLYVVGSTGLPANTQLVRSNGGESATINTHQAWFGWAAVDTVIRVLDGKPAVPEGNGFVLVDKTHLPANDSVPSRVNYVALYKKAWGLG